MNGMTWAAVAIGMTLGIGIWQLAIAIRARNNLLAVRVWSQRSDTTWPSDMPGSRVRSLAAQWLARVMDAIGSTSTSVVRRLELLGSGRELATFRLHQFNAATCLMLLAAVAIIPLIHRTPAGIMSLICALAVGALTGASLWDQLLSVQARRRQRQLDSSVPDASELLALAIGAGESVPAALSRVAGISQSHLARELNHTVTQIRMGRATTRALTDLAARNDSPNLSRLCQTLVTAIERGAPLAQTLHDQARDIREVTRQRLMEQGGRKEIAMLFPIVFLILPITVLFALYPGLLALQIGP